MNLKNTNIFLCVRGPEQSPSHKSENRPFTYENIIMNDEKDDASTQLQSVDKEGNGDSGDIANTNANGSCNDSPV